MGKVHRKFIRVERSFILLDSDATKRRKKDEVVQKTTRRLIF